MPAGAAAGVGLAAGTVATVAVVATPLVMDSLLPDPGADPDAARGVVLLSGGVTALAVGVTILGGGLIAGWAATALERVMDEAPPEEPAKRKASRPKAAQ